jgi:uncharacterized protein Yka (UPF0111/DUF47 family)
MVEKARIVRSLGETKLALPELVNAGLAANDRAKYLFTLLQSARAHAERPAAAFSPLAAERAQAGIDDMSLDAVVGGAAAVAGGYRVPEAGRIVEDAWRDVALMLEPIVSAGAEAGTEAGAAAFAARLERLSDARPAATDDVLTGAAIDAVISGRREQGDSLHLLVMDMHKALNGLQQRISSEIIDGARAYDIADEDRPLIRAFMRGVEETSRLRFDHPGLGTTATRTGERLVIQNDIGTTDAHVLVVHVQGMEVSVTYTDVHLQRLLFFQGLFGRHEVQWEDTRSRRDAAVGEELYHLSLGRYAAKDRDALEAFLAFLGSRIVFLIDWNRARKRLRLFLSKKDALDLLHWAAAQNHGHMAFLRCGGEQLVYDAIEFAAHGQLRVGQGLADLLPRGKTADFFRFVFRTCAEALLAGRPESLILDEVRTELLNHVRTFRQGLLDITAEHAGTVVEIASGIRDAMLRMGRTDTGALLERNAEQAKRWESHADELLNRVRASSGQGDESAFFAELVSTADDIADDLEEAAFHLTLVPALNLQGELRRNMQRLADLLVQGGQEYIKVIETARLVRRGGQREDMQDFLEAIHRIVAIEHQTDESHRAIKRALLAEGDGAGHDARTIFVIAEAARSLESAADDLMHTALLLRDHVLRQVQVS